MMKLVPVNEVIGAIKGEKINYETARVRWDRHVPEDYFEQQLFSQAIAHNVWETVSSGRNYMIPIQLKHAKDGCIAELSLPDSPNWDEAGKLAYKHWDSQGRLQGTIFIYDFSPRVYQVHNYDSRVPDAHLVEFHKARAFEKAQQFPIFYSIMSSPDDVLSNRGVNILFEFATTLFSRADQTNFYGPRQNLRPILEVPPGHEFYEAGGHKKPRAVRHGYVPAPDEDDDVSHISDHFPDKESYENWIDSSD